MSWCDEVVVIMGDFSGDMALLKLTELTIQCSLIQSGVTVMRVRARTSQLLDIDEQCAVVATPRVFGTRTPTNAPALKEFRS